MLLVFALTVVAALVVGDRVRAYRSREHRVAARRLRAASARGAAGDAVCVTGWIEDVPAPLRAPLSGGACAAYSASARLSYQNPTVAVVSGLTVSEQRATEFFLKTAEGRVRVRGERVELAFPTRRLRWVREERRQAFAYPWRLSAEKVPRLSNLREKTLRLGDKISVYGLVSEEPAGSALGASPATYREAPLERCLSGSIDHPLTLGPAHGTWPLGRWHLRRLRRAGRRALRRTRRAARLVRRTWWRS